MRFLSKYTAGAMAVVFSVAAGLALPSAGATNTDGGGAGTVFVPITPCRLFDTRPAPANVGPRNTPLGPGEAYIQAVTGTNGNCSIPVQASAVALNVTTVDATASSFLTVWPADATQPLASNLNWVAGAPPTPNKVDVKLSADGKVKLFNNGGTVNVLADVVGYYADHNHDDRYYTKAEVDARAPEIVTEQIPASALQFSKGGELAFLRNCASSDTPEGTARLPIPLPIGARLISVKVNVFDGGGANSLTPYTVDLNRYTLTNIGQEISFNLGHFTGGLLTANTGTTTLTPPGSEIAIEGFTYDLDFTGLTTFAPTGNGFCSAVVTYDVNG
jgi:hypothetical protein